MAGIAAVIVKIFPDSPEADLDKIKESQNEKSPALTVKTSSSVQSKEISRVSLDIIQAAESKVVGEAVTQFLRSTELNGKEKEAKLLEIAKKAQSEAHATSETAEGVSEEKNDASSKDIRTDGNNNDGEEKTSGSIIRGEVESSVKIIGE